MMMRGRLLGFFLVVAMAFVAEAMDQERQVIKARNAPRWARVRGVAKELHAGGIGPTGENTLTLKGGSYLREALTPSHSYGGKLVNGVPAKGATAGKYQLASHKCYVKWQETPEAKQLLEAAVAAKGAAMTYISWLQDKRKTVRTFECSPGGKTMGELVKAERATPLKVAQQEIARGMGPDLESSTPVVYLTDEEGVYFNAVADSEGHVSCRAFGGLEAVARNECVANLNGRLLNFVNIAETTEETKVRVAQYTKALSYSKEQLAEVKLAIRFYPLLFGTKTVLPAGKEVHFLTPELRKFGPANAIAFPTMTCAEGSSDVKFIFTIRNVGGRDVMRIGEHVIGKFHHSSLWAGKAATAAGEMEFKSQSAKAVKGGHEDASGGITFKLAPDDPHHPDPQRYLPVLKRLTTKSGHYKPTKATLKHAISALIAAGMDSGSVWCGPEGVRCRHVGAPEPVNCNTTPLGSPCENCTGNDKNSPAGSLCAAKGEHLFKTICSDVGTCVKGKVEKLCTQFFDEAPAALRQLCPENTAAGGAAAAGSAAPAAPAVAGAVRLHRVVQLAAAARVPQQLRSGDGPRHAPWDSQGWDAFPLSKRVNQTTSCHNKDGSCVGCVHAKSTSFWGNPYPCSYHFKTNKCKRSDGKRAKDKEGNEVEGWGRTVNDCLFHEAMEGNAGSVAN